MSSPAHEPWSDLPRALSPPPAADIVGAIGQTEHALGALTDSGRFEDIAVACLQEFMPSLRNTGGAGDEQRDGVGGPLLSDDDRIVLTVSLEKTWAKKVEKDLAGLAEHGHRPDFVIAVTNRRTGAARRNRLIRDARGRYGLVLRVIDVKYLALRLLTPGLLATREELLGLPAPQPPVALAAEGFARLQPRLGAPDRMIGRGKDLDRLRQLVRSHLVVHITGHGGIGKTRLALEAADRIGADRVLFVDEKLRLDADRLASELAGADHLALVIDNAHRCEHLHQIVGLLLRRTGPMKLILIARPGYDERLRQATEGTRLSGPDAVGRLSLAPLGNAQIGALVRAAEPALEYEGALERIVQIAAGNPLVALIAHDVAVDRGGLQGLAFDSIFSEYARSAVAAAVQRTPGVQEDDLKDLLAVMAALGPVDADRPDLIAALLGAPVRTVRNRLHDLADAGLVSGSGEQFAISPDLLSAQILYDAHISGRQPSGVPYRDIWQAADDRTRSGMCSALGALHGYDTSNATVIAELVGDDLADLADAHRSHALRLAQSVAPGLPDVAVRVVDVCLAALPDEVAARERALLVAMEILSRVPDPSRGWPRQLAVSQAFFASPGTQAAASRIKDALSEVYKRLPINTSSQDGYVLAFVQDVLARETPAFWDAHRDEPGAAQTIAIAAGQLMTLTADRTYMSPEDDRRFKMTTGSLPGGERTANVLRTGVRLLLESLPQLDLPSQQRAAEPIVRLKRISRGLPGPFGHTYPEELVRLAGTVLDEIASSLTTLDSLPLPTRATLMRMLRSDPWPDDATLRQYRSLLLLDLIGIDRRSLERGMARAARHAEELLAADDLAAELRRWQLWVDLTRDADNSLLGASVIEQTLAEAARRDPDRMAQALPEVLHEGGGLADYAASALGALLARPDGEQLATQLTADTPAAVNAAVARGLVSVTEQWADALLERLGGSDDPVTRAAVASTGGWTTGGSDRRFLTGLKACLPAGVGDVLTVLYGRQQSMGSSDAPLELNAEAAGVVAQIARNAARSPRIEGAELIELARLASRPRMILDFCFERLRWLAEESTEHLSTAMDRDSLPEELEEPARAAAEDADRRRVIAMIEDPALSGDARSAATELLGWIDDHDIVTGTIGRWLTSDDDGLKYWASKLLRATRDPDRFRERARELLAVTPPIENLRDMLLDSRDPVWWIGAERSDYGHIVDEFSAWAQYPDGRLAEIGEAGAARFQAHLDQADPDEDEEGTEWE